MIEPPGSCPRLETLPSTALPGGLRLACAERGRARLLGLAALDPPPGHWALHLPRCRSVHTFGMRFPLDLVWLDIDGKPVRVDRGVGPRRLRSCLGARSVVEVVAGSADAWLAALAAGSQPAASTQKSWRPLDRAPRGTCSAAVKPAAAASRSRT